MNKQQKYKLDKKLAHICEQTHIPGMGLIIAKAGTPIFHKYYGWRDVAQKQPVTADTIFGAASLTKSLTALSIMQLDDAGKLHVNDSVKHWLPELSLSNDTHEAHITIHHLLSHTSGLPGLPAVHAARIPSVLRDPDGPRLFDEMPDNIDPISNTNDLMNLINSMNITLLGTPGEVFNYSNEGFALLQVILERASGVPFKDYINEHIFQPLNMHRSVFETAALESYEDVTELYAYETDRNSFFHSPVWWDVGAIFSNGSLKTCAADLLTYLNVYRQGGLVSGARILSEKGVKKMTTPHVTTPNGVQYGYGLQIDSLGKADIIGHGGSIKGVSSNMQWAPGDDLTGVILINIAGADAAGMLKTAMQSALETATEENVYSEAYQVTEDQLETYTGYYQSGEGQWADVQLENGELTLRDNHGSTTLQPCNLNQFYTPGDSKITFIPGHNNNISGIFIGMRHIQKLN